MVHRHRLAGPDPRGARPRPPPGPPGLARGGGRAEWFTGTVWQDRIVEAPDPARIRAVRVAFEPGARTAWHTHPLGQTLHVVAGIGRVQRWNGPVEEIRPGDTV